MKMKLFFRILVIFLLVNNGFAMKSEKKNPNGLRQKRSVSAGVSHVGSEAGKPKVDDNELEISILAMMQSGFNDSEAGVLKQQSSVLQDIHLGDECGLHQREIQSIREKSNIYLWQIKKEVFISDMEAVLEKLKDVLENATLISKTIEHFTIQNNGDRQYTITRVKEINQALKQGKKILDNEIYFLKKPYGFIESEDGTKIVNVYYQKFIKLLKQTSDAKKFFKEILPILQNKYGAEKRTFGERVLNFLASPFLLCKKRFAPKNNNRENQCITIISTSKNQQQKFLQ